MMGSHNYDKFFSYKSLSIDNPHFHYISEDNNDEYIPINLGISNNDDHVYNTNMTFYIKKDKN